MTVISEPKQETRCICTPAFIRATCPVHGRDVQEVAQAIIAIVESDKPPERRTPS